MTFRDAVRRANARIAAERLTRTIRERAPNEVDFASNDYLGLAADPAVLDALRRAQRVGSGGSRLLSGADAEHRLLEDELAVFLGRERVRLFSSGYLAMLGAIRAAAALTTGIRSERENHACAIDAIRLTRLPCTIYDDVPGEATGGAVLVVTESLFSMSGRRPNLRAVLATMRPDDVLVVDEAHALGVLGPAGAGRARELDDDRVVIVGTLSKAFGALGGFVAGNADFVDYLTSVGRTFIFDTSLPPAIAAAARAALRIVRSDDARRERLFANARLLRAGIGATDDDAHIVPIVVGDADAALRVARALADRGFFAPAIRPPTVPPGRAGLRLGVRGDHRPEDLLRFAAALGAIHATTV